jgi:hypothetical protein
MKAYDSTQSYKVALKLFFAYNIPSLQENQSVT